MKCFIVIGLLVTLTSVFCEDAEPEIIPKQRPTVGGVIYLLQPLYQREIQRSEYENEVPNDDPYLTSKLFTALTPNNVPQDIKETRDKRSPSYKKGGYGGGGGGCNVCGGGSGGYPGGGGGYPGGGGYGGGGGGGGGQSGSWSQASASSGSFGSGHGYGKK